MTPVALYEGVARHHRAAPIVREFSPRLFLAYLDVDALPGSLDALPGWSGRHRAPVRFHRRDFLDGGDGPLGDAVRDLVEQRLGRRPNGPVYLLAQLRTFGWLFNPLSVYYCWDTAGDGLDAVVLEVTNTPWGERHWYVLDGRNGGGTTTMQKAMYVSPFVPMEVDYRVTWTAPGDALDLDIQVARGHTTVFSAGLALRRTVLDRRTAVTVLTRYPLLPFRVSVAIYRKALSLFLVRAPLYRHQPQRTQEVGV